MQACGTEARPGADARDRRLASLVGTLREASIALDEMWRDAVAGDDASRLVELGDASYGVHLALVALEDGQSDRRTSAI
jgi:hypothetical protein